MPELDGPFHEIAFVLFVSAVVGIVGRRLGQPLIVAFILSSTSIIAKLLTDKGELEQPHGRVAMGILIVQDLVVVPVMISSRPSAAAMTQISPPRWASSSPRAPRSWAPSSC